MSFRDAVRPPAMSLPGRAILLLVALLPAAASARQRFAPCADAAWILDGGDGHASVVLRRGTAAVTPGCPAIAARIRATATRTRIRARWTSCPGLPGPVTLNAIVAAPACDTLTGSLRVRDAAPRVRRLAATRAPYAYDVPLDPTSPWPKFRRTAAQDARSPVRPSLTGGTPWTFPTGKGIFSSPVIGGDGTVYIGSADRTFYAIAPDGTERWRHLTGEIIDSSALLDDRGRLYVGSGDGKLYAFEAASGAPVWTFAADPSSATGAFINWFEGNVAITGDGTLVAPNDNFLTYAIDRDDTTVRWRFRTVDQTWSLPAYDVGRNQLFMGNNNLLTLLGRNTFSMSAATGEAYWQTATDGSIAASPLRTDDGTIVVGGFDGFVRAYDQATGALRWEFGTRDHIYASPAALPDGTLVQPSADGTVYALDPATGALRWQFDTRDAIRSSPAVDGDGNVYVGSGEGRLFVLNPDGTLRWSMRLIDAPRDDLNASPALGADAIVIAGESGEVFHVPYDWCLRPAAAGDARCTLGPKEDLPDDGAALFFTTRFGRQLSPAPAAIDANQPLTFSLYVRRAGDTVLAHIDSSALTVTTDPPADVRVEVSGDRKFVALVPRDRWLPPAGGTLAVTIRGPYLVNPARHGLQFSGGEVGGRFDQTFTFAVRPTSSETALPLPVPAQPGDPAGLWEVSRIAQPLPTILPSYNQIGFDSIHYFVGLVEDPPAGDPIAWVVGARLAEGENRTVVDPATRVLFPLEVHHEGGLLTMLNRGGFAIEFNRIRLPFEFFRIGGRIDATGAAVESPALNVAAPCAGITFYGPFLRQLGFCNPQTDVLTTFGALDLHPAAGGGVQHAPSGVGTVTIAVDPTGVTATLAGSTLRAEEHSLAILLVDATTDRPVAIDYGFNTSSTAGPDGAVTSVRLAAGPGQLPPAMRAYLMVDAYPAARAAITAP